MSEKIRHIHRDEWLTLHDKAYARERIMFRGVETEAQLMRIGRADAPFSVPGKGGRVVIADDGYSWLQLAPKDGYWWMTAMYTPDGKPVQYYFDITDGNVLTGGRDAWFEDMYLDYVLHTDGTLAELDRDELDAALENGEIDGNTHTMVLRNGEMLREMLNPAVIAEFDAIYARLRAKEACPWAEL